MQHIRNFNGQKWLNKTNLFDKIYISISSRFIRTSSFDDNCNRNFPACFEEFAKLMVFHCHENTRLIIICKVHSAESRNATDDACENSEKVRLLLQLYTKENNCDTVSLDSPSSLSPPTKTLVSNLDILCVVLCVVRCGGNDNERSHFFWPPYGWHYFLQCRKNPRKNPV